MSTIIGWEKCQRPEPHLGHQWPDDEYEQEVGGPDVLFCAGRLEDARQPGYTPHQGRVLNILGEAQALYAERSLEYRDNYKLVGRTMEALFPNGAPALHDQMDFNRWHIFELIIVKLTRYVVGYESPTSGDHLADMNVYLAILGALDLEVLEIEAGRAEDEAKQVELVKKLKQAARSSGLFVADDGPNYESDDVADDDPVDADEIRGDRTGKYDGHP